MPIPPNNTSPLGQQARNTSTFAGSDTLQPQQPRSLGEIQQAAGTGNTLRQVISSNLIRAGFDKFAEMAESPAYSTMGEQIGQAMQMMWWEKEAENFRAREGAWLQEQVEGLHSDWTTSTTTMTATDGSGIVGVPRNPMVGKIPGAPIAGTDLVPIETFEAQRVRNEANQRMIKGMMNVTTQFSAMGLKYQANPMIKDMVSGIYRTQHDFLNQMTQGAAEAEDYRRAAGEEQRDIARFETEQEKAESQMLTEQDRRGLIRAQTQQAQAQTALARKKIKGGPLLQDVQPSMYYATLSADDRVEKEVENATIQAMARDGILQKSEMNPESAKFKDEWSAYETRYRKEVYKAHIAAKEDESMERVNDMVKGHPTLGTLYTDYEAERAPAGPPDPMTQPEESVEFYGEVESGADEQISRAEKEAARINKELKARTRGGAAVGGLVGIGARGKIREGRKPRTAGLFRDRSVEDLQYELETLREVIQEETAKRDEARQFRRAAEREVSKEKFRSKRSE